MYRQQFGQQFSTRVDVLEKEFTEQLSELQDKVPPFDSDTVVSIIESEFGVPISEKYEYFDPQPLAAASLGQVHLLAKLNGETVIVKVQRSAPPAPCRAADATPHLEAPPAPGKRPRDFAVREVERRGRGGLDALAGPERGAAAGAGAARAAARAGALALAPAHGGRPRVGMRSGSR